MKEAWLKEFVATNLTPEKRIVFRGNTLAAVGGACVCLSFSGVLQGRVAAYFPPFKALQGTEELPPGFNNGDLAKDTQKKVSGFLVT
ncbi:MAG: hypothetical protein R6V10_01285 [bacterium]